MNSWWPPARQRATGAAVGWARLWLLAWLRLQLEFWSVQALRGARWRAKRCRGGGAMAGFGCGVPAATCIAERSSQAGCAGGV